MPSSTDLSASVTGVRSGLFTTCRSSALYRLVVSESASSARTWASRRSSVKVVGMSLRLCPGRAAGPGRPGRRPATDRPSRGRSGRTSGGVMDDRRTAAAPARRARRGGAHPAGRAARDRASRCCRGWRWLLRWPTAAASRGLRRRWRSWPPPAASPWRSPSRSCGSWSHEHSERGELLANLTIVLAVVVVVAAWLLPGPSALASGKGDGTSRVVVVDKVLPVAARAGRGRRARPGGADRRLGAGPRCRLWG